MLGIGRSIGLGDCANRTSYRCDSLDNIMSNQSDFQYNSFRAHKARIGRFLTKPWRALLLLLTFCLFAGGVALIVYDYSIGWLVASLAVVPAMVVEWWKGDLHHLKPSKNGGQVDNILSGDLLGRLSPSPTPEELATVCMTVPSGQFFAARFGIGGRFLQSLVEGSHMNTEIIWEQAFHIREVTKNEHVTGSVLLAAIITSYSGYENLIAHLQLSKEDIFAGIKWREHIRNLIKSQGKHLRTGGIARDWSFGYIPLLSRFGHNISAQLTGNRLLITELPSHRKVIDQMLDMFGNGSRQNAVIVGPTGVGKTTVINEFASRLLDGAAKVPDNLRFRQIFILDSSSLIAAAPGRGELEHLIMQVLGEAYAAKNIIICLDNAQLFFEEGVGSVDLTNVILPILEAGNMRIILTMDEQRLLQIGQRNPAVINALNKVTMQPASKEETLSVMQDHLVSFEYRRKVTYMYQALLEAYRLSERYVHDLAMPGRAIKLLESAASYAENGIVSAVSVQQAIEQTMNVKVGVASGGDEREKLLNLEQHIHERMINQTRAVSVVSDALRRARAGVRNQDRPIGTFLFLGPTGVGKTELAKALSDVYFSGESNIIRLDMNEFVRPEDVSRLIADGGDDPNSLTAQAMKQPFSVVLLDEIEKAHPQVLTTLLQLLDEGILRDIRNREVSFRDAIIIATSNAGADRIREYIERGYKLEQFEKEFIDELINTNQFRPEFLNRFDEMVVFRPLSKDELVQVIDLILTGINKTLANQKVSVNVSDDAKLYLVDKGYDPRLGARPMRRVVQRAVENTVAKQMLAGEAGPGSVIEISLDQVQQILDSEEQANSIADQSKGE